MENRQYDIWEKGEYTYPAAFGFIPNLRSYIHGGEGIYPAMIVVPGGGYSVVSPTEADIVAREFYHKGFNAFVLTYTTDLIRLCPIKKQPMKDLSRAIRYIRKRADKFGVDENQLVVCGFSAGGHLCGSICVHYEELTDENPEYQRIPNRPNAAILSYPVILMNEFGHQGSALTLLGEKPSQAELDYMSLERHVKEMTPPCFIWQTAEDESVPVENSFAYAQACRKAGVSFAYHVFSKGHHGLSLANEDWARGDYGNIFTMQQTLNVIEGIKNGIIDVPEEVKDVLLEQFDFEKQDQKGLPGEIRQNTEVKVWPELAATWLRNTGIIGGKSND